MKKLVLICISWIVMICPVMAANEYKLAKPSVTTLIWGDIPLHEQAHLSIELFHDWNSVGDKNVSDIYSYLFYMHKIGNSEIGGGLGVTNSPVAGVAGIVSCITYGQLGIFRHYSEVDLYLNSQVNVWVTSRWLVSPIENVPINVGAQLYLYNTSFSIAPEIGWSISRNIELAFQMQFDIVNGATYFPRGNIRAYF